MVEAAEVEEGLQPRPLDAREVYEVLLAGGDLVVGGLERGALGELTALLGGDTLEEDGVGHATVGVLGLEVDGGLEAMPEAVDVHGVRVEVLSERVRVLDEEAERLRVVGRLERACRLEHARGLASLDARLVEDVAPDDHRLEDGLQSRVRLVRGGVLVHGASST